MKRNLLLIVCLLNAVWTLAATYSGTGWSLNTSTGVFTVTADLSSDYGSASSSNSPWKDYRQYIQEVVITSTVNVIGRCAFNGCYNLKKLTISDGDSKLTIAKPHDYCSTCDDWDYDGVWDGCPIETIYLGRNLQYFDYDYTHYSYDGYSGLTDAKEGQGSTHIDNVKTITFGPNVDKSAFSIVYAYPNLTSVVISNSQYTIVNDVIYNASKTELVRVLPYNNIVSYTIPSTVTSIQNYAFQDCSSLTSVTIPNSVTSIGSYAFYNCSGLTSVTIPNSVTSIGNQAFRYCIRLASVTIPNSVTSIGAYAFSDCTGLTSVTVEWTDATNIVTNYYSFYDVDLSKATLHVPAGTKALYEAAKVWKDFGTIEEYILFADANVKALCVANWDNNNDGELSIEEVAAVTSLGEVFKNNTTITSFDELQYFTGLTSIGNYAFYECSNLTSITIPNSVTSVGSYAFYGCISLPAEDNLRYVDSYLVGAVDETLSTYTIKEGTKWIGSRAFYGCSGLVSINIPNSVTSIGEDAFRSCSSLTSATIPNSVTSIVSYAFKNCSSLTSITIPNSVTSIEKYAFSDCSSLTSVTIPNSVTSIGEGVFYGCSSLTSVAIPNSVTSIRAYAFSDCSSLTSITIPGSVTSIGKCAFSGCSDLTSVTVEWIKAEDIIPFGENAFNNVDLSKATLYIPAGTKSLYEVSVGWTGWKDFGTILEPSISVTGITLSNSSLSLNVDGTSTLTASVLPENATDKSVTWTSNNESVATVSSEGVVTAVAAGTATITATTNDGSNLSASCEITVNSPTITFADANVKALCAANWDTNGDGELSASEAAAVTDLGEVFKNNTTITSFDELQYFTGLTSIGDGAFISCSGLTSITIPNSVTSIVRYAFYCCSGLTSVTIPNSVTSIGFDAFWGCLGLTSVTIPNSLKSIEDDAFVGCLGLTSINIPSSVTSIGVNPFDNCPALEVTTVSDDNTYFSDYDSNVIVNNNTNELIAGCKNSIIPSSVTSIGVKAFCNCIGLTSVTIPNSVTSIGVFAFRYCSNLTSVTVEWTNAEDIVTPAEGSFENVDLSKATLYVPTGTKALYKAADVWKEFGTIIEEQYTHRQDNILYAANAAGRLSTNTMELPIYLNNSVSMCAAEFYLTMPEGVKIKYEYDEDEEDYVWGIAKGGRMRNEHAISCKQGTNGDYHFICSDLLSNKNFYDSEEKKGLPFMTLTLELDESLYYGDYEVMIHDLILNHNGDNGIEEYKTDEIASLLSLPRKQSLLAASNNEQYGTVAMSAKTYDEAYNDVDYNDNVTLTATPAQYCKFVKWTNNGEDLSTENPLTIAVVSDMNITAVFDLEQVNVTFNVDGAKYSSGLQNCGAQLTLPDAPEKTGYTFKGWENVTEYTVVPASDVTYEAVFEINKYTVLFLDYNGNPIYQQSQDWNSDIVAPADPSREDWFFLGWSPAVDATVPLNDVTYTAQYTLRGDVTGDNVRNVTDLTTLVNIILNKTQVDTRTFTAADVHVDDVLNITDLTSIVNLILNVGNGTQKVKSINGTSKASLSMDDVNAMAGFNSVLNINLTNGGNEITAGQFDLVLPEGVHVTSVTGTGLLASSHMVGSRIHEDGTVSVLFFSMSNDVVKSDEGSILNIGLEIDGTVKDGSYDIVMKDAVLATADEQSTTKVQTIGVLNVGNATSITGVAGSDNTTDDHNLSGLPVSAGYKGVVIKNGKKNLR